MEQRLTLTRQAHKALAQVIENGDIVIDETAGNGHDTLFMAQCVGETGRVFAFDIQQQAIESTRHRLMKEGNDNRVSLFCQGHETMLSYIPAQYHGRVKLVMFNLGYLPGSDKTITTQTQTSLEALQHASQMLKTGGVISIMAYPGHPGGTEETNAVSNWIKNQPEFDIASSRKDPNNIKSPQWSMLIKI